MFSRDPRALLLGALWIVVGAIGIWALEDVAAVRDDWFQLTLQIIVAIAWAAVFIALAVPCTLSLTTARMVAPAAIVVAVLAGLGHGPATAAWIALLCAALAASGLLFTAEIGSVYVQGSAYGSEFRSALRAPAPVLVIAPIIWSWAIAGIAGGLMLIGHDRSVLGGFAFVMGTGLFAILARACHQLSRRWLVLVPAGLVLHDPMTLADTIMMPRSTVRSVGPPGLTAGTATDVTGSAPGLVVEITLDAPIAIALAGRPGRPGAQNVTTSGLLVVPSRPGRFLRLAAEHRLTGTPA